MADVGDDKIVGVHEHPEPETSGSQAVSFKEPEEAGQEFEDDVDMARIERVYK